VAKVAKVSPVLLPQKNVLKTTAAPDTEVAKKPTQTVSKTVSNKVSPVLLPQNVSKTTTEINDVAPVARTENAASNPKLKKPYNTFHGEGVITFLFQTKMWGRIRLATRTKWGENQVFFHRNHLVGSQAAPLFHGQSVKVEYFYRRGHKSKMDSLRAHKVEIITTDVASKKKWSPVTDVASKKKWSPVAEKKSWRSRSMMRRPFGPPRNPTSRYTSALPSVRVAKGPPANGHRGFNFRRSALVK